MAPRHARLRIELATRTLTFCDPRNFGTFKLATAAGMRKKMLELGPDIARHDELPTEFGDRYRRFGKNRTIAEVLLDQRVFCGVGNYMRADGMYEAGIDPRTPAFDLTHGQLGQLWTDLRIVANGAYTLEEYVSPCYGRSHDAHDNPIDSYKDRSGRTVWWCPARQAA